MIDSVLGWFDLGDEVHIVGDGFEADIVIADVRVDSFAHPIYVKAEDGRVFFGRNIMWIGPLP